MNFPSCRTRAGLFSGRMKKSEFAELLARESRRSMARAADELDEVAHQILKSLRHGSSAELPGLGTFTPGRKSAFRFRPAKPVVAKGRK